MKKRWLNYFFNYSGWIFSLKGKILSTNSWLQVVFYSLILFLAEIVFMIVSLPLYFMVSPEKIQEEGFIFPKAQLEKQKVNAYVIRRKISLSVGLGVGMLLFFKIVILGLLPAYFWDVQPLLADTQTWTFVSSSDYIYDTDQIEILEEKVNLKQFSFIAAGSTTNPGFEINTNDWNFNVWNNPGGTVVSGSGQLVGGNPDGYAETSLSSNRGNRKISGYWQQEFSTTVDSPDVATLNFDWKSITYLSPIAPTTYQVYAVIDEIAGEPEPINRAVWSSGEITDVSQWSNSGMIDVLNKLDTASTYYLKLVAYVNTPKGNNDYSYVSGFDNVSLNWSKELSDYSTSSPTIEPVNSLTLDKAISWDNFSETATKNGGEIYYQLSADDGITWQYWNDTAWEEAISSTNYSLATVVNDNINKFSTSTNQIKWRAFLVSDGSQQVSLSAISIMHTPNSAPIIINQVANQDPENGLVYISYDLQDEQSDLVSLVNYEYSLTGDFSGEQVTLNASTTDLLHQGVDGLTTSPAGENHIFVWDAQSQLGKEPLSNVYLRLRVNDGIINSDFVEITVNLIDFLPPVITGVVATGVSTTEDVQIVYDLYDDSSNDLVVEMEASNDGGITWDIPVVSVSGAIGSGISVGLNKVITWDAGIDYDGTDKDNMQIQIRAKDVFDNQSDFVPSNIFSIYSESSSTVPTTTPTSTPTTTPTTTPPVVESLTHSGGGGVVIFDHTPPVKPYLSPIITPTKETTIFIGGLAEPNSTINLYNFGELILGLEQRVDAEGKFGQLINLNAGNYLLSIKAVDGSGNISEASNEVPLSIVSFLAEEPEILPIEAVEIEATEDVSPVDELFIASETTSEIIFQSIEQPSIILPPAEAIRISTETLISPTIPTPQVNRVNSSVINGVISFSGISLPNKEILVYIHSDQAVIYRTRSNDLGSWKIDHLQSEVELSAGQHTVYAVTIDSENKLKSTPSSIMGFEIKRNFWVMLIDYFNFETTLITLIILILVISWLTYLKIKGYQV